MLFENSSRRCMEPHPTDAHLFCARLVNAEGWDCGGPHGWDYEMGAKAVITRGEVEAQMRAAGLGHIVDREAEVGLG